MSLCTSAAEIWRWRKTRAKTACWSERLPTTPRGGRSTPDGCPVNFRAALQTANLTGPLFRPLHARDAVEL